MKEAQTAMKITLAALALLSAATLGTAVALDVPRLAITSPEKITMKEDFGKDNPKWKFVAGKWVRRTSAGLPVLAQTVETQPWAVAILEDQKFDDLDVAVRFRPISGKEDASGGIIFRARDGRNYLLVRANALENNFRLYTIVNGKRSTMASATVTEPKLGEWHRIRVVAKGPKIQAYLNDALLLDHDVPTAAGGWVGLWTKADSVTEFSNLEVTGTPAK
jgi:Domain of Unknown Function (DUF1080)